MVHEGSEVLLCVRCTPGQFVRLKVVGVQEAGGRSDVEMSSVTCENNVSCFNVEKALQQC